MKRIVLILALTLAACLPPARTPEEQQRRTDAAIDGTRRVLDLVEIVVRVLLLSEAASDPGTRACLQGLAEQASAGLDRPAGDATLFGAKPDPCAAVRVRLESR